VTEGDALAELVRERGLGLVVPPQDAARTAGALCELLAEPDARGIRAAAFSACARELTWERVAEPLVAFCRHPHVAADREAGAVPSVAAGPQAASQDACAAENERLRAECAALREQVSAYERGRFMRLMAWLKRQQQRLAR